MAGPSTPPTAAATLPTMPQTKPIPIEEAPEGEIYFAAENPKGELGFYINSKGGGVPHRLKIRAPSFVNLSILSELLVDHMVSDIPTILGSLDFVMGECDR